MPSFKANAELITAIIQHNPKQSVYIEGAPGNGKTSLCTYVGDQLGIPRENQVIFRPSLHDPVDLLGIPYVNGHEDTCWAAPFWLQKMQQGRWLLVIDELPQAAVMMQNALSGLILDRFLGECKLSDEVVILTTGNRVQDKAGANKLLTQLGNRLMVVEQESNATEWCDWAIDSNLPVWLVSFIKFRPSLLNAFDAARASNPTERSWAMVGALPNLPEGQMFTAVKGLVGEGAAAEAVAFKAIADKLPDIELIRKDPKGAPCPTDPATLYAVCGALASSTSLGCFSTDATYVGRMPKEFQALFMQDAVKYSGKTGQSITASDAFVKWVTSNSKLFMG